MSRFQVRISGEDYRLQVLAINDAPKKILSSDAFVIENICKGGLRFISPINFELDDRLLVSLTFPDGHSKEILGRICYNDPQESNQVAYGFSVMQGFYVLK